MTQLAAYAGSLLDLLLVVLGFGLIIFVHELGHFIAAKWAGIRVLAFAIGFGPAAFSWRQGLGWRRGSSEREYRELLAARRAGGDTPGIDVGRISPTEYRLNYLPLGGYVKMLGQEDANPGAVSTEPDSYQNCPVWKRMVVISAGVVMNLVAAAVLFVAVFMTGLKTEPATVGYAVPGMPASEARPVGNAGVGSGLRSGDKILRINGRKPNSFNDLVTASAMSRRGEPMQIRVSRAGVAEPIDFEIQPKMGQQTRLLEIGVWPAFTGRLVAGKTEKENEELRKVFAKIGLEGVEPGMTLVRVGDNRSVLGAADLEAAVRDSGGTPVEAEFAGADGRRVTVAIHPKAALQIGRVALPSGSQTTVGHLLGLTPLLKVEPREDEKGQQGLNGGDMFARVGQVEFPSIASGIAEVRRHEGRTVEVEVLRQSTGGVLERVRIQPDPKVDPQGHIGFYAGDAADESSILALPVRMAEAEGGESREVPAATIIDEPGMRVVSVAGTVVSNFTELRAALRSATEAARKAGTGASVAMVLELAAPVQAGGERPRRNIDWTLSEGDVRTLHGLGWDNPISLGLFEPDEVLLRAEGSNFLARAGSAVGMGLGETKRVMVMTYATFARLFEGTVKVEHLKGPVGIAHMGTQIAEKGMIWLLFFMGLISVNLAVVNFLPLPIVDGGQFLFLVLEKIRGRPLSIEVQNIATVAGLLLIGTMFVIVTFHDIMKLFG